MRWLAALLLLLAVPAMGLNWDNTTGKDFHHDDHSGTLCDASLRCFTIGYAWTSCVIYRLESSASDDRWLVGKYGTTTDRRQLYFETDAQTAPTHLQLYVGTGSITTGAVSIDLNNWYISCIANDGVGGAGAGTFWTYDLETRPPTVIDDAVTFTTANRPDLSARVEIGTKRIGQDDEMDGDVTYVSHFAEEFTTQDVLNYAANPCKVRAQKSSTVKFFLPQGRDSPVDWSGNANNFTRLGSGNPTEGDNPPVGPCV